MKIIKPGFVAEKKAYFESQFKGKIAHNATTENVAPLIQKANGYSIIVDDSNQFDNIEVHEEFVIINEERIPDVVCSLLLLFFSF